MRMDRVDLIINDEAVCDALDAVKLGSYVTDFPNNRTKKTPQVIGLPHLGASTVEAEDNCAVMVADQVREYLETGNIVNSVNFPNIGMARNGGYRLIIANKNIPKWWVT